MRKESIMVAGTYSKKEQTGIHGFCMKETQKEEAELEEILTGSGVSNPSYLAATGDGNFLYAVMEDMTYLGKTGGGVASFRIEGSAMKLLNTRGTDGTLPCHIILDEKRRYLFAANYGSGSVSMFHLNDDGSIGKMCDFHQHTGSGPNKERQESSHVHFLGSAADQKGLWAVDLGDDRIKYYEIDEEHSKLAAKKELDIVMPGGVGPRHFVQNRNRKEIMYVICELSSEIYVIRCGRAENTILQRISTLPEQAGANTAAAIHISEDNRFVYASNRGDDSIAVFRVREDDTLELVEITKTNGKTPRDFCLYEGKLFSANQDSHTITMFDRDEETGKLTDTGKAFPCKSPVCLITITSHGPGNGINL